jgi:hypothetical protein
MSANDSLALPFDIYQRYLAAAQVAEQVRAHLGRSHLQILDVGGFGRTPQGDAFLPLARFLAHDSIVAVDLEQESVTGYAVASGLSLPFPDKSFDLVTSCDTFEHIPPSDRPGFIHELLRVSSHYVVLIAPFDSDLNRQAEHALHDYLAKQGLQNPMLQEHLDNGLPSLSQLEAMLSERRLAFVNLADGYLPHWLIMMLITVASGQSSGFCLGLNRRYNHHLSPGDRREPAYRRVIVIAQPGDEELLPGLTSSFCSGDSSPVERDIGFAADLGTLLIQTGPATTQAGAQLAALEAENAYLRQVVTGYEQGKFIRFMRYVHNWRRKVDPQ